MKPRLLIIELWGLGDLVIATPFLQAARERYQVTLLAKPYAVQLGARFWPEVEVIPFVARGRRFRENTGCGNGPGARRPGCGGGWRGSVSTWASRRVGIRATT